MRDAAFVYSNKMSLKGLKGFFFRCVLVADQGEYCEAKTLEARRAAEDGLESCNFVCCL